MGGDFVVPGTATYQYLHSDLFSWEEAVDEGRFGDRPPFITANFVVKRVPARDGPMRIIPGTQRYGGFTDELQETDHMALAPLKKGSVIIRDARALHGGTPNLGPSTRYLPSVDFVPRKYLDALDESVGKESRWALVVLLTD